MAAKKTKRSNKTANGRPSLGTEDPFARHGGKPLRASHGWLYYYATDQLYVSVKQEHIDRATARSTNLCVLGLAFSDMWGDRYDIEVSCTQVRIIDTAAKKRLVFTIPLALQKRLRAFDRFDFWDLPPSLYRVDATPKPKRPDSKKRRANNKVSTMHLVNGQISIGARAKLSPKKKIASPTRFVSKGRIVWPKKNLAKKKKRLAA